MNSSQLRLESTSAVFSPLFFILELEALSRDFSIGAPWELLYADDLLIIADSLEKSRARLKAWKDAMEKKGCRVNMSKTKFMISGVDLDVLDKSGIYPCAVYRKNVGSNAIICTICKLCIHKRGYRDRTEGGHWLCLPKMSRYSTAN